MSTEVFYIDDVFLEGKGLGKISSELFTADHRNYGCLALQPKATIVATQNGFTILDPNFDSKLESFLATAIEKDSDLTICPEYCFSWSVLGRSLQAGGFPSSSGVWIFGCQSITWAELTAFKESHPDITWIVESGPFPEEKFLDPTCYFFRTNNSKIAVVQFKTESCGDGGLHLERNHMATGNRLYVLRKDPQSIHISAITCSDSFSNNWLNEIKTQINTPYLIIHPQLNDAGRQLTYANYRRELFRSGNKEKEVIALNWSRGTVVRVPTVDKDFPFDVPYSAYYSQSEGIDLKDDRIVGNHQLGLYISRWEKQHAGIFVFYFDEATFYFESTKASQSAAEHERRGKTGPKILQAYKWQEEGKWRSVEALDDGFGKLLARADLGRQTFGSLNVTEIERVIYLAHALTPSYKKAPWFDIKNLPSFTSTEEEVIRRYTFTHDNHQDAVLFRDQALSSLATLIKLLDVTVSLPAELQGLGVGWIPFSSKDKAAFNFQLSDGTSKMLFAYAGAQSAMTLSEVTSRLWNILGADDKHRLVIWYQDGPTLRTFYRHPDITEDTTETSESITRETDI